MPSRGQGYPEGRTLTHGRVDLYPATVFLDYLLRDRKAKARTLGTLRAEERLEDRGDLVFGNPASRIGYGYDIYIRWKRHRRYLHPPPFGCRLYGIGYDIEEGPLHANGIDGNGKIIGAKGAVPYIENLPSEAIARFREQVEIIDMIGTTALDEVLAKVGELANAPKDPFGDPIIVEFVEREKSSQMTSLEGKIALHKDLIVDPYLEVREMSLEAVQ